MPDARGLGRALRTRNLPVLAAAQAAAVTGTAAMVTLGGIIGRDMAPRPELATVPLLCMSVGTAGAAVLAAALMARLGRRTGFAIGALLGCIGALLAVRAVAGGGFFVFCAGAALVGMALAFSAQYRFAAVESVPPGIAGYAVSCILAGSLVGAVAGTELAARGALWLDAGRFAGTFAAAAGCYALAGVLLLGARFGAPHAAAASARQPRPLRRIAAQPSFLAAVLGAASGYGVMVFVMTAAPLAMHAADGHSLARTAAVVQAHVLAMYAPALIAGPLIARCGEVRVMRIGALALACTLAAGFAGREVLHYGAAMVALGIGWNFLYTAGTTLLGQTHTAAERFRVQAVNDFAVFGASAGAALGAGAALERWGWDGVLWASAPFIAAAAIGLCLVRTRR